MGDIVLFGEGSSFSIHLPKHGNHVVMGFVQEYLFLSFGFILVMLNREAICPFFLNASRFLPTLFSLKAWTAGFAEPFTSNSLQFLLITLSPFYPGLVHFIQSMSSPCT